MSLETYILSQTTGDNDTSSQVLTQNTLGYFNNISLGNFFSYKYPTYSIEGATFDYYGKDFNSISYDITNGKIYTLFFSGDSITSVSGNTGSTLIIHDLYRLPFSAYTDYVSNPDTSTADVDTYLTTPLVSIEESVSAITIINSAYTYSFPTEYKEVGNFTQYIFSDKDQYIIDTVFSFEEPNDMTLGDCYYLDTNNNNTPTRLFLEPSATTTYRSGIGPATITGNTPFSGSVINGAFFTYFVPPKKANLNVSGGNSAIAVQGTTTNLSPVFNFANVDDGDYYQLQVNYNTDDTPYSGTDIYTYIINKQVGDAEFVRTFSTPLRSNDSFIYRIGNTKEVTNIFGNKQSITTWSNSVSASIEATGQFNLSGKTWRNYINNNYNGHYSISGMTIGTNNNITQKTFNFITQTNVLMVLDTISASTNGLDTVTVDYNGNLNTYDWKNALYSATSWSSLGLYVVGESINTAITDSSFSFTTSTQVMEDVTLTLQQIYNNTQLDLGIDIRSSSTTVLNDTTNYTNTTNDVSYNRTSGVDGSFDFGLINGGYYRLIATPPSPKYAAYEQYDYFITIDSNTNLNLVFYILWGNQSFSFDDLSNETFL